MTMTYDLEERTLTFNKNVLIYCKTLQQDAVLKPIISQVVRSSGSIGANYIEANEALSKKDFVHRLKISRKEAKETIFWLESMASIIPEKEIAELSEEALQLNKILSTIIVKSS
jgi:four helix bundle protein